LEIDKWARIPSALPEFIKQTYYGQINYYLVYEFMGQKKMLANIKWTNKVSEDMFGTISFMGYGATQFIDITTIDRCVGFMEIRHKTYIIDKEYMEEWDDN